MNPSPDNLDGQKAPVAPLPSLQSPEPVFKFRSPLGIVVPLALTMGALAVLLFHMLVPYVEARFVAFKKCSLRELTQVAVGVLAHYAEMADGGRIPLAEARRAAIEHLRQIRFGNDGKDYFWINDRTPRIIMHPYRPELEDSDVSQFADPGGKRLFMDAVQAVAGPDGAGFIDYTWQWQDNADRRLPKISHVRLFRPWGWIVGTGLYIDDVRQEVRDLSVRLIYGGLAAMAGVGLLAALMIWQGIRAERSRREAWLALHKRGEEQRAVLESAPQPVVVYDRQGTARYINPAFTRIFGWTPGEVMGQRIDFVPDSEREKTLETIGQAYAQGSAALETRRFTRDGRTLAVQISAAIFNDISGTPIGMVVNLMDITAQKQTEAALLASQEIFQTIGNTARDAIVMIDDADRITYWNRAGETLLGYSEAEALGQEMHRLVAPERFQPDFRKYFPHFRQSGTGSVVGRTVELSARHKQGHEVPIELSIASVRFKDRWHAVGILRDIADRKQAEMALRDSEDKYRRLVENASDAIFVTQDGVIKFPNRRMLETSGYDEQFLKEVRFIDLIHPDYRPLIAENHAKRLQGKPVDAAITFQGYNRQGDLLWLELNAITVEWEGRPAVLNFMRDITEKKRLEAEIQQAHRLESLGTLAGGIAHDFNNLLMGILGNTALLLAEIEPAHPHHQRLKDIDQLVRSGAELTGQLLGFARGGKYEVRPTDLNQVVGKNVELFGRTHKEVTIQNRFQPDLWPVEIDRGQIGQVLINLLVNAWQAMPGGGELTVATANVELNRGDVAPYDIAAGRFVRVTVADTGIGMDDATRQRIFEPFFTTRQMRRGTGLGLASAYGIIRNHGGIITVTSQKGVGSTFEIYLPASDKPALPDVRKKIDQLKGNETILLVDDEDMILVVAQQLLARLGYKVITAAGGQAAVEIFQRDPARIDLVILDMIMPGLSGEEVFEQMRAIAPKVRILLSSGYSEDGEAKAIMARGCDGFIQKPFDLILLSQRIREVLDKN